MALQGFSRAEVARHNREGDLWVIIHGSVYDLSRYDEHPGGIEPIVECAGKDATSAFEAEGHSEEARREMA